MYIVINYYEKRGIRLNTNITNLCLYLKNISVSCTKLPSERFNQRKERIYRINTSAINCLYILVYVYMISDINYIRI